ncbi:MAG: PQQ-dependent sugar dehydrogenase [Bacteroidota bacterium]
MRLATALIFFALSITTLLAQPQLEFTNLGRKFTQPVDIVNANDGKGRLFVAQKRGLLRVYYPEGDSVQTTTFLDFTQRVLTNSERGLLGVAFHPSFPDSAYCYINYISNGDGPGNFGQTVVSRFAVIDGNQIIADPASEVAILAFNQPFANHNGGDLAFGPDGYLYIPTGDGGSGGDPNDAGQDPQSLLGKLLRIDVDRPADGRNYGIPTDNPFVDNTGILDEIWALGLRNPWRVSFDRTTGDLWIADVGQVQREEINFQASTSTGGENYGWDCREGLIAYNGPPGGPSDSCTLAGNFVDPVFDYDRSSSGGQSITGGYVYRGPESDELQGHYICSDYELDNFFIVTPPGPEGRELITIENTGLNSITTFGEAEDGKLYAASIGGNLYRIVPKNSVSTSPTSTTAAEAPTLSPNPTEREFIASIPNLKQAGTVSVRVVDLSGKTIYERLTQLSAGPQQLRYRLPKVPAGLYK